MSSKKKTPKITFVGGKWYDERGKQVAKPAPKSPPLQQDQQQELRYGVTVRADGCTCTRPQFTGHVPGCRYYEMALYQCETADRKTVTMLAKLASCSIVELEARRLGYQDHTKDQCPDQLDQAAEHRRRCWTCPYWNRHADETPFDHQKGGHNAETGAVGRK
jgi:hypothetical protein